MSCRNRLLIVSCGATKCPDEEPLPAIERYNGPFYTTLRKFLAEHPAERGRLSIMVLSAEYGLINGYRLIPDYDHLMTPERAVWLHPQVSRRLATLLQHQRFTSTFINLGRTYMGAFTIEPMLVPLLGDITEATGGIGQKRGQMRRWLEAP